MNEPSLYDGGFEINKGIEMLYMKQVNKFSKVKIVIKINFNIEKVIFIVYYVKDVNKSVTLISILKTSFLRNSTN